MIYRTGYGKFLNRCFQEGKAKDNRLFLNAIFWILRSGAPWRDLPPDYGDWKNTHRRFCRWRDKGIWEQLLELLIDEPDMEWLMVDATYIKVHAPNIFSPNVSQLWLLVDATYIKVHPQATGAVGGNQIMGQKKGAHYKGTPTTWMHVVYHSELLLHRVSSLIAQNLETLSRRSRRNPHR